VNVEHWRQAVLTRDGRPHRDHRLTEKDLRHQDRTWRLHWSRALTPLSPSLARWVAQIRDVEHYGAQLEPEPSGVTVHDLIQCQEYHHVEMLTLALDACGHAIPIGPPPRPVRWILHAERHLPIPARRMLFIVGEWAGALSLSRLRQRIVRSLEAQGDRQAAALVNDIFTEIAADERGHARAQQLMLRPFWRRAVTVVGVGYIAFNIVWALVVARGRAT